MAGAVTGLEIPKVGPEVGGGGGGVVIVQGKPSPGKSKVETAEANIFACLSNKWSINDGLKRDHRTPIYLKPDPRSWNYVTKEDKNATFYRWRQYKRVLFFNLNLDQPRLHNIWRRLQVATFRNLQ